MGLSFTYLAYFLTSSSQLNNFKNRKNMTSDDNPFENLTLNDNKNEN